MSAYIIAIGGTGAKFAQAVVHTAASGLFKKQDVIENLNILFVDPDKGNGNLSETTKIIKNYQECYGYVNSGNNIPWMATRIEKFQEGLWSPVNNVNFRLRDAFKYDNYSNDDPIKNLFEVLYTQQERDLDIQEGFRGRPAVGSAVMTMLNQEQINQGSWQALIEQVYNDYIKGETPKIFLCGSIFGGTGASGFPTLGRLIAEELEKINNNLLSHVKLGGLLMLPYFHFTSSVRASEQEIYARPEEFLLKTEAALNYYGTQKLKFDTVYLLGTQKQASVNNFSTGGKNQRNPPHFLELYGALSLRDFLFTNKSINQGTVVLLSHNDSNSINWYDFPEKETVRANLVGTTQFAFAWLSTIAPDFEYAQQKRSLKPLPWALRFFRNYQEFNNQEQRDIIRAISEWSKDYLLWIGSLHRSSSGINLLNVDTFIERNGELKKQQDRNQFYRLVKNNEDVLEGVPINTILHDLAVSRNQSLTGVVDLATALYHSIVNINRYS
jgi:hypothetical protein